MALTVVPSFRMVWGRFEVLALYPNGAGGLVKFGASDMMDDF